MMGKKDRIFAPLPPISLEDLVPPDSFYRHLERTLDLGFVRNLVREVYADSGRPSIDPVVFFKLQLILFFEGLRSERQLMQVVADRLSLRWYLGYDLSEALPDHARLSRIRQRYGLDVFRRFFEVVVEPCVAAGLVWGQERSLDATKVAADAALASLQPRFAVEAHLAQLFAADDANDADDDGDEHDGDVDEAGAGASRALQPNELTQRMRSESAAQAATRHDWIGQAGRPDRTHSNGSYRRTADVRVSTTDPDATPMPLGDGRTHLGYQDHDVVDGGKARIILTALVTPAAVQENQPALDLLWRARFRWKLRPRQVTGDTTDGTVANIAALERAHIHADLPLSAVGQRAEIFSVQDFRYDVEADVYHCPGGAKLCLLAQSEATHRRIDQAPAAACTACALRAQCTTSPQGRRISRSLDEAYRERVRGYHTTEAYAKAMRKRQVWVEPLFAEAKTWHGLRRFRLGGLQKVNGEALLIAAGQNRKRLLSRRDWGRRPFPNGAAGIALPPRSRILAFTP
jgi:transposase